jgi:type IV secretion system protein TrbL
MSATLLLLPVCDQTDATLQQQFVAGYTDEQLGCEWQSPSNGQLVLDWLLGDWVKDTRNGLGQMIKDTTTSWVRVPSPAVADDNGQAAEAVHFIQQSTAWYTAAFLVVSILFGGAMVIWSRRPESLQSLIRLMVMFIAVSAGGVSITATLVLAGDQFSTWIIDRSLEGSDFGENLYAFFNNNAVVVSSVATLLLMAVGLIVCGIQYLIMLFRGAALFVLVGTLPFAASFYLTETGQQMLKKQIGWIIAFCLYKPAAAIVYATGFRLMGAGQSVGTSSAQDLAIHGVVLILLAIFTLPAIMRLVTPAVNELTSGRGAGGSAVGAATMAVGSMAAAGRMASRAAA